MSGILKDFTFKWLYETIVLLYFFHLCQPFSSYNGKAAHVLNKNQTITACGGVEVLLHALLSSALDRGEWSPSRFGRLTLGKSPRTHWIENCLGPTAGLDLPEKATIFILPGIEPRFLCRQFHIQVAIRFRNVRSLWVRVL
jgi:hypothetical protein